MDAGRYQYPGLEYLRSGSGEKQEEIVMPENAGTIFSEVRIEIDKLKGDIKKVETRFDKFGKNSDARSKAVQKNWTTSFKKIGFAGVAAFVAIGLAVRKGIKTFSSFEQSLANVQSVARATPEEFAKIEEAARAAGETTKFTASEAADALYSLASAGLSATEATAALDGVLKLAGATQADLAFTSATVTAALSQFGLEADQSTEVANTFAAAIGNSQANMTKLANAFRQVGPVAGALGKSIQTTTGDLQALFDAGFKGEQAGTALRNIYSSLTDELSPTARKLKALGVAFEDINPAINSTAEIIGVLSDANLDAGEIINSFGQEAGPALLSLLEVGKAGLEEYTEAITGTNAAAEAYAIQMNTLQGDLAELRSATESVAISFVKEFAPAIRAVVNILTKIVRAITKIPGPIKLFLGILITGIPIIIGLSTALSALGGIIGTLFGPVSLIVGGIAALVVITEGLITVSNTAAQRQKELKKTSAELTKTIEEYEQATIDLEAAIKSGNKQEAETLRIRKELLKNQLAVNLKKDIAAIKAIDKEEVKQNKTLGRLTNQHKIANAELSRFNQTLQDELRAGRQFSRAAQEAQFELGGWKNEVKLTNLEVNKQKIVIGELQLAREEGINTLARAVAAEQLSIAQIRAYDQALAKEVVTRVKKLEQQEKNKKATEKETTATADQIEKDRELAREERERIARQKELEAITTAANEKIKDSTQDFIEKLEDLGATEEELIELQRQRAQEEINNSDASIEAKIEAIEASDRYFNALQNETEGIKDISKETESYETELLRLVGTEQEVIEAERQRAIVATRASGASEEAIIKQEAAINKLFDTMSAKAEESADKQEKSFQDYFDTTLSAFQDFTSALDGLFKATADKEIAEIERALEANLSAIDAKLQTELAAKGVLAETETERLQREIAEAIDEGETITANQKSNELERLQITQKFEAEKTTAREESTRQSAELEYQAALSSWRLKIVDAIANAAAAIVSIWATWAANPIVAGILTAGSLGVTGVQLATINQAKPEPPSFQTGGIVLPSGPRGRQVTVAENGSPELLLNGGRSGEALLQQFATAIVKAMGGGNRQTTGIINLVLNMDGKRVAESSAQYYNNGQVRIEI
jgi:TP901 family phage tail tape measure protein